MNKHPSQAGTAARLERIIWWTTLAALATTILLMLGAWN